MRMAAQRWELDIRPERGARITSLRLDGEELLDQGIGVDQPTASGFIEGGAFGWDEMVPNLEPTDALLDHGEAWRLPWEVMAGGRMRCRGRLMPWELERQILLGDGVDVNYTYRNAGPVAHTGFWCAHPLFKYESDMAVSVSLPPLGDGASSKVFLPRGSADRVSFTWRSGAGVAVSWDPDLAPDVAIWACNGDIGGYHQIAVEPSWTRLEMAPGETCSWWLRIDPL